MVVGWGVRVFPELLEMHRTPMVFIALGCGVGARAPPTLLKMYRKFQRFLWFWLWGGRRGCVRTIENDKLLTIFIVLDCGVGGPGASRTIENY